MSDPIFFAPLRVPVIDSRTGLMAREWYLFFQAMFLRIGGTQSFTPDDLQLLGDVNDATEDGNDIRTSIADLERTLADLDDSQSSTDLTELQALSASFCEDPIISRFTAQWDGLSPASGGGTAKFLRADGNWAIPSYPTVPVSANPTATIGLAAVNGVAATYMTSDSAPALSQGISPTWTGNHTFTPAAGTAVTVNGRSGANAVSIVSGSGAAVAAADVPIARAGSTVNAIQQGPNLVLSDTTAVTLSTLQHSGGQTELWQFNGSWVQIWKVLASHAMTLNAALGVNGNAPPAQVSGFGTPTGTGVIANFPGATATLAQCSQAIAQIIKDLKAFGLYAA
jgi:hypothetical protein